MKKFVLFVSIFLFSLTGCGGEVNNEIGSTSYDEAELIKHAHQVVEVINTYDYEQVVLLLRSDLQSKISSTELKEAWDETLVQSGKFISYDDDQVGETKSKTTDEIYGVVVVSAKYEKDLRIFTLTFDSEYELVGLYMK